jgi:LmbE family N-acetylglucosaminyl deacetylase
MRSRGWLMDGVKPEINRVKPDVRIDVRDFLDTKYEALNKHVSQNGGIRKQTRPEEATEEFITVLNNTK